MVERKNGILQEFATSMLDEYDLPKYFWAETVNTVCYILNRVLIRHMGNLIKKLGKFD